MAGKILGTATSFIFVFAVMVVLVALFIGPSFKFPFPFPISFTSSPGQKLFKVDELALYNGTDEGLPILLGILGSVFDVTKGKSHYGVGGGYNHFSGRDASRAFVSGNFTGEGLTDSLRGLSNSEVKSVVEWRSFYHKTYTFVGKLVGLYYDDQGNPTKHLKGAEAKAARGAQLLKKQKQEEDKLPSCNSKWSQGEGGEVWCDDGFPRLVQRPLEIALTGKMGKRCACFREDQLGEPGLEVYEGCDYQAKTCHV
ncbi:membrane-associated progesterone-binding protein 4 isoform X1 [Momordica charantia]|uniref:Membrane-associated progesterone-binding protein 4 isoform X1 n=1 Tax=Momordica charantia TaxID=3673 RepID=A0A6J1C5H2_MOMCH|nr:membrane-associated progesterone-binding protein 4 isoform X1 [Momordica charantia]